ncbi:glycoside hydrolase family 93 protein [Cucurbitaria berberidis CBS 394.84]|uniref:Glycoside hydrolase family 93 protein n=1 Tax=Cucurbitaria berberidis CBS 394.84 TaxID=1168544 RepID=A0A9P4GPF8_9PLEO|nr:glycoside hydrolase family 93 protein [Cucurbitaria berberidis CBS 394.84]KAF1849001.1 glycoside hydrolase family 93 protein [Cucurbitaria berberidis CBS 394.84]
MRSFKSLIKTYALLLPSLVLAQAPTKLGDAIVFGQGGTYPRAIKLADGKTLLGVYTATTGANTTLTTVRSTNNGASWQPIGIVDTGSKATKDVDNPYVYERPDGKLLCAFRNHDRSGNAYSFYRITVCISEDGGVNWNFLQTPASDPGGLTGNWEPFLQRALDGSLQLYYSRETSGTDQDSLLRRSTDGGATWSSADVISGAGIETRDGMLGVAHTPNDSSPAKVAIFETGNPSKGVPFSVWTVRTENDGANWSEQRTRVYQPEGHNAGAPQIIRVGDKLVASFGTDEDGGAWPSGAIKVMVSRDGGKTWADKTTVVGPSAAWAGLLALDDSSFLVLYEKSGTSYAQKLSF